MMEKEGEKALNCDDLYLAVIRHCSRTARHSTQLTWRATSEVYHNSLIAHSYMSISATKMMMRVLSIFIIFACIAHPANAFMPSNIHTRLIQRNINTISTTQRFLNTADFKNGMTLEIDGVPVKIIEFLHVKPGKGSAFVRSKIKNLTNGSVQERTFRAGESVVAADITKVEMQYTFTDGDNLCFMNMETFEEQRIEKKKIDNVLLMKEGLSCNVMLWNDQVIDVQLPPSVEYVVVECPPNFAGNTAQGGQKPATLDSGAIVQVPMFIEVGEKIMVSTDEVKYLSRSGGENSKKF